MDFRELRSLRKWLAVGRNARLVRGDQDGIADDDRDMSWVLAERDCLPAFVALELRETESTRHLHVIFGGRSGGSCIRLGLCDGVGTCQQRDGGTYSGWR